MYIRVKYVRSGSDNLGRLTKSEHYDIFEIWPWSSMASLGSSMWGKLRKDQTKRLFIREKSKIPEISGKTDNQQESSGTVKFRY